MISTSFLLHFYGKQTSLHRIVNVVRAATARNRDALLLRHSEEFGEQSLAIRLVVVDVEEKVDNIDKRGVDFEDKGGGREKVAGGLDEYRNNG